METIAGITGKQFLPRTKAYTNTKYQYASSSYQKEHNMNPGLIIQPHSKQDIILALEYAKTRNCAVAIRTGGHQYSGASSTGPRNIQLDLERTFRSDSDRHIYRTDSQTYVRTSVSWSLGAFNEYLTKNHLFVPHGQCTEVHLGGHVQTGGYGQLGRSFGLLGDHVISLEIITHDGQIVEVNRKSDPELFYAFLGGSPGNLGVLTHFTLKVHRDEDYHGSLGLKAIYWYDPDTLKRLVDEIVNMADNPAFPRNYDLCVSVLSSSFKLLDLWPEIDGKMRREHPEIYGESEKPFWPRAIIVYAQWVPFSPSDKPDMAWFERLNEGGLSLDGVMRKPMSELTGQWIFRNVREFDKPYVKRTYLTNSTTLGKDGWAQWVTDRIDAIVKPERNQLYLSAQLQCFGGRESMFTKNAGNGTAYSWRDSTVCATLDAFYAEGCKSRALDWQKVNDLEGIGKGVPPDESKVTGLGITNDTEGVSSAFHRAVDGVEGVINEAVSNFADGVGDILHNLRRTPSPSIITPPPTVSVSRQEQQQPPPRSKKRKAPVAEIDADDEPPRPVVRRMTRSATRALNNGLPTPEPTSALTPPPRHNTTTTTNTKNNTTQNLLPTPATTPRPHQQRPSTPTTQFACLPHSRPLTPDPSSTATPSTNNPAFQQRGVFSAQDRRVLWGSWGEFDLDKVWPCYFESREKYDRLRRVRARVDPRGVFTPNKFGVPRAGC